MLERDRWQGRPRIHVAGWGVHRWLERHFEPTRSLHVGELTILSATHAYSESSIEFGLQPPRDVCVTNSLQVVLLAARALASLPDQDLLRNCRLSIEADSLRANEVSVEEFAHA